VERITCSRFHAFFLLASVAFVVGIAGDCHGQEQEYARVRYYPEQREQLKGFLYETTPTLNWGMDDKFLYSRIRNTTATLYAKLFSFGPYCDEWWDFRVFSASAMLADRGYDGRRALEEGSHMFGGFPREDKNFFLYIDSEPRFSRVSREILAKRGAALKHFAEVRRLMPNVRSLGICFRGQDVTPCFPLLDKFPGSDVADVPPYVGFRNSSVLPDNNPVWVEEWEEYYLVWRTETLEVLAEDKK